MEAHSRPPYFKLKKYTLIGFTIVQILQLFFATLIWGVVITYFHHAEKKNEVNLTLEEVSFEFDFWRAVFKIYFKLFYF